MKSWPKKTIAIIVSSIVMLLVAAFTIAGWRPVVSVATVPTVLMFGWYFFCFAISGLWYEERRYPSGKTEGNYGVEEFMSRITLRWLQRRLIVSLMLGILSAAGFGAFCIWQRLFVSETNRVDVRAVNPTKRVFEYLDWIKKNDR